MWMSRWRRYFISGLAVVTPVVLTIYVIGLIFKLIDVAIGRYLNSLVRLALGFEVPGLSIVLSLVLIFFVGLLVQNFLARRIMAFFEHWVERLPLVGRIYSSLKRIAQYFFQQQEKKWGRVVLIEYPRKGMYSIAFLSSDGVHLPSKEGEVFVAVFVPTSPSPLTGFLEFVRKDEVIALDVSVESALQAVVSGGVVLPEGWVAEWEVAENE